MTSVTLNLPTWSRYRYLHRAGQSQSILRCLEYERLARLKLEGLVLDFGGGSRTNYTSHIPKWGRSANTFEYESANIDPCTEPTYLLDKEGRIPVSDGLYDCVLSLNTLEHVFDLNAALSEIRRVVRQDGNLVVVVPFIFRVHGHPDDYHRGTPSFWEKMLNRHSFGSVTIECLVWGPFSTAYAVSGTPGPFKSSRRTLALLLDLYTARRRYPGYAALTVIQDDPAASAPLGYFIQATAK